MEADHHLFVRLGRAQLLERARDLDDGVFGDAGRRKGAVVGVDLQIPRTQDDWRRDRARRRPDTGERHEHLDVGVRELAVLGFRRPRDGQPSRRRDAPDVTHAHDRVDAPFVCRHGLGKAGPGRPLRFERVERQLHEVFLCRRVAPCILAHDRQAVRIVGIEPRHAVVDEELLARRRPARRLDEEVGVERDSQDDRLAVFRLAKRADLEAVGGRACRLIQVEGRPLDDVDLHDGFDTP